MNSLEIIDNTYYKLERGDIVRFNHDKAPQSTRKFWIGGVPKPRLNTVMGTVSMILEEGFYIEGRASIHKFKDIRRIMIVKDREIGGITLIAPRCNQRILE